MDTERAIRVLQRAGLYPVSECLHLGRALEAVAHGLNMAAWVVRKCERSPQWRRRWSQTLRDLNA